MSWNLKISVVFVILIYDLEIISLKWGTLWFWRTGFPCFLWHLIIWISYLANWVICITCSTIRLCPILHSRSTRRACIGFTVYFKSFFIKFEFAVWALHFITVAIIKNQTPWLLVNITTISLSLLRNKFLLVKLRQLYFWPRDKT